MNRNSTIIKSLLTLTGCLICNSIFATANLSILPSLSSATLPPGGAGSIALKITNTSGAALSHIDIYNLRAPFSKSTTVPSTCTGTLANGASCSIEVNITDLEKSTTFSPTVCAANGAICNVPLAANRTKVTVASIADAKAYIPNAGANDVSVIDLKTDTVESTTIPVENSPTGISVSPNGRKVYVSNLGSNSVTAIDTSRGIQNAATTTIHVGNEPAGLVVSPDGSKTYVCNKTSNSISVINTTSNTVTDTIKLPGGFGPLSIAASPDGSKLFVTAGFTKNIAIIDTATNTHTLHDVAHLKNGTRIIVSKDGAKLYIADISTSAVIVFNITTNTVITTIPTTGLPMGLALSPDGSQLYVTNESFFTPNDNTVSVINTHNDTVEATISQTAGQFNSPAGISVSPDNKKVLVANSNSGNVSIINIPSNTLRSQVTVGSFPIAFGNFIG